MRLPSDWRTLTGAELIDVLYSMLVDDSSNILLSRDEASREVDQVLYDAIGEDESRLRRTWGTDSNAQHGLSTAASMFPPSGGG